MTTVVVVALLCIVALQGSNGVIYTRWGRTTCPPQAIKIYSGYMAGGMMAQQGNGANYLCMHDNPEESARYVPGTVDWAGAIAGLEYEITVDFRGDMKPFSWANNFGRHVQSHDVPCVTCYSPGRTDMLMIPGRSDCGGSDMQVEYKGFIWSQTKQHPGKGEYVCLDEAPEAIPGGDRNDDQGGIRPVEVVTGSLPGPPYKAGNEILCAVCTI